MISIEYLAGFFDGEGTFSIIQQKAKHPNNPKLYPKAIVILSQSGDKGLKLLEETQQQYSGSIYEHLKPGQHKATKSAYKLYWNKEDAIQLIKQLLPHLKIKQEEAQKVYNYLTRNE